MKKGMVCFAVLTAAACGSRQQSGKYLAETKMPGNAAAHRNGTVAGEEAGGANHVDLSAYVGKYPPDAVNGVRFLEHPDVRGPVEAVLPSADIRRWIFGNTGPQTPIAARGTLIISHGCEAHNCSDRNWTVHIDQSDGSAQVCYFELQEMGQQSRWYTSQGSELRNEECPSE